MSSINEHLQESRVHLVLLGTIIPTAIGTLFVAGHLYTRGVISRNLGWADLCILVAWTLTVIIAATNILFCRYGGGHHIELQDPANNTPFLIVAFVSRINYQVSLMMVRIAICLIYARIFQDKTSRIIIYTLLFFQIITTIPLTLLVVFQCDPIASQWDLSIPIIRCLDPLRGIIAFTACSVFSDAMLIAFAVPRVLPLNISKRQKAILVAIMSFGILVIIAALLRFYHSKAIFTDPDYTWNLFEITTWSSIELNTALFCVSAPSLRPLVRKLIPEALWAKIMGSLVKSQPAAVGTVVRDGNQNQNRTQNQHPERGNISKSGTRETPQAPTIGHDHGFRMLSRFTVGGSVNSIYSGKNGKDNSAVRGKGRERQEWEMSVLGSRKGSRSGGDEEDLVDLVRSEEEEEERQREVQERERERIRERMNVLMSPNVRTEITAQGRDI